MDMTAYRKQYEEYLITRVELPKIRAISIEPKRRGIGDNQQVRQNKLFSIRENPPARSRPNPGYLNVSSMKNKYRLNRTQE